MKIEYDVNLYKEIAKFKANDIVEVRNRKGRRSVIHVQNITKLTWQQLQLLISDGEDRFSKITLLYRYYNNTESSEKKLRGVKLSAGESDEIHKYIDIYQTKDLVQHHEVNTHITANNLWGQFPILRSMNDHGNGKVVPGIQPKYFEIVCKILNIDGDSGASLKGYKPY